MAVSGKVARVISATMLTPTTIEVAFEPKEPMSFAAGQYVVVEVGKTPTDQPVRRSYSIANAPTDPRRFDICVKLVPGGMGSTYLSSLKGGEDVTYLGPLGKFTIGKQPAKEYVFIATGTGLSPCLSIVLDQLPKNGATPMHLFWGLRNEQDLYYHDRLLELEKQHANFKYTLCMSQPSPSWSGQHRCRVTKLIAEHVTPHPGMEFYMAGNGAMIDDVKKLLSERGVTKDAIKTDVFF